MKKIAILLAAILLWGINTNAQNRHFSVYLQSIYTNQYCDGDDAGASNKYTNGTHIHTGNPNQANSNQIWDFREVSDNVFEITCRANGKYLTAENATLAQDGTLVMLWDRTGGQNQQWSLIPAMQDVFYISCIASGRVIDNNTPDRALMLWSFDPNQTNQPNHQWKMVPAGDVNDYYAYRDHRHDDRDQGYSNGGNQPVQVQSNLKLDINLGLHANNNGGAQPANINVNVGSDYGSAQPVNQGMNTDPSYSNQQPVNTGMNSGYGSGVITVFSEDGDNFRLLVNGQARNDVGQPNVKADGLPEGAYSLKVIFDDTSKGSITKKVVIMKDINGNYSNITYSLKYKKGDLKMKLASAAPMNMGQPTPPTPPIPPTPPVAPGAPTAPVMFINGTEHHFLKTNDYLVTGDYLTSRNRQYFMQMEQNGNFAIYKGSDPNFKGDLVWSSNRHSDGHDFFLIMQDDGNFCAYKGTSPGDNRGVYFAAECNAGGKHFIALLRDDGVLAVYHGDDPDHLGMQTWASRR
jgi:hypothetical protein